MQGTGSVKNIVVYIILHDPRYGNIYFSSFLHIKNIKMSKQDEHGSVASEYSWALCGTTEKVSTLWITYLENLWLASLDSLWFTYCLIVEQTVSATFISLSNKVYKQIVMLWGENSEVFRGSARNNKDLQMAAITVALRKEIAALLLTDGSPT